VLIPVTELRFPRARGDRPQIARTLR